MMWEAVARVLDGSRVNHDAATGGVARLLKQQAALEAKLEALDAGTKKTKSIAGGASSLGAAAEWETDALMKRIDTLQDRHNKLLSSLESEDGKFKEAGTKIHAGVDEEAELNKMHAYLKWVAALNSISSDLQQLVDCDGAVDDLRKKLRHLSELVRQLEGSQCSNLLARAQDCLAGWRHQLTSKVMQEFLEVAGKLGIPYTSFEAAHAAVDKAGPDTDALWKQLEDLLQRLLSYENDLSSSSTASASSAASHGFSRRGHHLAEPLRALFAPLFVRFATHFAQESSGSGGKKDSNRVKPGFMFRTVRGWIDCNRGVLSERLGRMLQKTSHKSVDPYFELIKGFAVLLRSKLTSDLDMLSNTSDRDAVVLCVAAREMLQFDKSTLELYGFDDSELMVSSVVTNDDVFCERWLDTEYRIIGETLDEVCPCLRSDIEDPFEQVDQWQPAYEVLGAHDRTRVPQSAQGLIMVFESVVALVKLIPDVTLQERVVSRNQIRMLQYYRETLQRVANQALTTVADRKVSTTVHRAAHALSSSMSPGGDGSNGSSSNSLSAAAAASTSLFKKSANKVISAQRFFLAAGWSGSGGNSAWAAAAERVCMVANGLWFVHRALVNWDDDMLYVDLESMMGPPLDIDAAGAAGADANGWDAGGTVYGRVLGKEIGAYSSLLSKVLHEFAKETCAVLTQRCLEDYITELEEVASAASSTNILDLSAQLGLVCSGIEPLLQAARRVLSPEIARGVWINIARIADEALLDAVLNSSGITEGMAAQLQHDMVFGIFRLFAAVPPPPTSGTAGGGSVGKAGSIRGDSRTSVVTMSVADVVERKESDFMIRMTEACRLLTLDEGTWSRMNGLLSMESCVTDQIAELRKLGVVGLSRQDAADIVKLRVDKLRTANPAGT